MESAVFCLKLRRNSKSIRIIGGYQRLPLAIQQHLKRGIGRFIVHFPALFYPVAQV
jgi:hypothetical protein